MLQAAELSTLGDRPVGFLTALGEWSQRTAAHVKGIVRKGMLTLLLWGGYVPSDADFRCAGRCRRWRWRRVRCSALLG